MSKEYSELSSIIDEAKFYKSFDKERKELEKIINDENSDSDMKNLANSELSELISKKDNIQRKLITYLLPKDEADKNAIIEIRAGTGGLKQICCFSYSKCMKKFVIKKMVNRNN